MNTKLKQLICSAVLFIMVFAPISAVANDTCCSEGGIVYGDRWAFLVNPPKNWSMSTNSGLNVNAVFSQNDETAKAKKLPPIIYITVTEKLDVSDNLDKFILRDETQFQQDSKSLKVTKVDNIVVDGINLKANLFSNYQNAVNELVVYQQYQDWFYSIVLSVSSEENLESYKPALMEVLDSFKPMLKGN